MDQLIHSSPQGAHPVSAPRGNAGLWRVKVENLGTRQYRILGRVFEDFAAVLPAVLSRLVDIPIYQLPASQPSVERNGDADPGVAPPIYLPSPEHPSVLIERTIDSCRISIRFQATEPELKVPLQLFLKKLRHSVLGQCTLPCPVRKDSKGKTTNDGSTWVGIGSKGSDVPDRSGDQSSAASGQSCLNGQSSTMDIDEFTTFMNHVEDLMVKDIPVYDAWTRRRRLIRKRPVPGYDLSLIVLASDLRVTSASVICNEIINLLVDLDMGVCNMTKNSYQRCTSIGAEYFDKIYIALDY